MEEPCTEKLLTELRRQNSILDAHREQLTSLRDAVGAIQASVTDTTSAADRERVQEAKNLWKDEISSFSVFSHPEGLLRALSEQRRLSYTELLSAERTWNSAAYRRAYPHLAAFLAKASFHESSRAKVQCEELLSTSRQYVWSSVSDTTVDHENLWMAIGTRVGIMGGRQFHFTDEDWNESKHVAPVRMLKATDLSPLLSSMILASTPRLNMTTVALFLERYLSFSNWAQTNLFRERWHATNAFVFEYHCAFYFIPSSVMDPELAVKDFRGLRKCSPFASAPGAKERWIYEEQLSFLLYGTGRDLYTCYQLAERYFTGPYVASTGFRKLFAATERFSETTPTAIFLDWISFALHHVNWRWQAAIDAVDVHIDSASHIIFSETPNPDLLSDDSQFTKSKTYFWALQAYKMFEDRLLETIATWETFREKSLYRLHDGRIPSERFSSSVNHIEASVSQLQKKLERVRKKCLEVQNLREGLFGASSLFDSRTAVRQGDNIRLLTYITLLFLPLSFSTSIFGMQVMDANIPPKYLVITFLAVTVSTALLIFNLETLGNWTEAYLQRITSALRNTMSIHHRHGWQETAQALQQDHLVVQAPIQKIARASTRWAYLVFVLEAFFILLPVHEVKWAYSNAKTLIRPLTADPEDLSTAEAGIQQEPSRSRRVKAAKDAEAAAGQENGEKSTLDIGKAAVIIITGCFRALLLVPWTLILGSMYSLVLLRNVCSGRRRETLKLTFQEPWHWLGLDQEGETIMQKPPSNQSQAQRDPADSLNSASRRSGSSSTIAVKSINISKHTKELWLAQAQKPRLRQQHEKGRQEKASQEPSADS